MFGELFSRALEKQSDQSRQQVAREHIHSPCETSCEVPQPGSSVYEHGSKSRLKEKSVTDPSPMDQMPPPGFVAEARGRGSQRLCPRMGGCALQWRRCGALAGWGAGPPPQRPRSVPPGVHARAVAWPSPASACLQTCGTGLHKLLKIVAQFRNYFVKHFMGTLFSRTHSRFHAQTAVHALEAGTRGSNLSGDSTYGI